ncbi:MAG: lipid-A-disaccharide synthase [Pseudomonadota bacterium]
MKIFVTAGEPSGDRLGAALIAGLRALVPDAEFRGVAGPLMQGEGMQSLFPMDELSVMGIAEVLPKYRHLMRRINETAQAAVDWRPDVMITIDSPDFSLRVAKRVRAASNIRTVHYVAPTVWAWRPERAEKMAAHVDHVLALFPFEPPFMAAAGMDCDFVGHPIVTEPLATPDEIATFKAAHLGQAFGLLTVLPGSRKGEVERLIPVFSQVLKDARLRDMQIVLPTLPNLADTVRKMARDLPGEPTVLTGEGQGADQAAHARRVALAASDLALAASGTVSLELAAARTPMVIAYDMNWISRAIIKRKLLIDTVTLVNLVSETRAVPEYIFADCQPPAIADALVAIRADPSAQTAAMELTMQRLGEGGDPPGLRAARAVLDRLD